MDLLRAAGIGMVAFAATLIINALAARTVGVDLAKTHPAHLPASIWLVAIVSCLVLSPAAAWWYFRSSGVVRDTTNGMLLGLVAVLTGVVLDCVAIVPRKGGVRIMRGYFESVPYWVALAVVFLGCTLVGASGE